MKKFIMLTVLLLAGCNEAHSQSNDWHFENDVDCKWNEKYHACFCGRFYSGAYSAVLTWAPDKVCGH